MIANRYDKLAWSTLVHHWLTAAAVAMSIILGSYSPFSTWYGFIMVSAAAPPICFTLGFRATYSFQHPNLTRAACIFSYYFYSLCLCVNIAGQLFIACNALLFHFNESIHVAYIAAMCVAIIAWLFDDIQLLRALKEFSSQHYECADVLADILQKVM